MSEAKPKRQLTEDQRLAFMKGREKRLANIERKRQEKIEAAENEPMAATQPEESIVDETPSPPPPVQMESKVEPQRKDTPRYTDDDFEEKHAKLAAKIADLLYGKLSSNMPAPPPPQIEEPKKKRTYTKRAPAALRPKKAKEVTPPDSPEPVQAVQAPPQRIFNWM